MDRRQPLRRERLPGSRLRDVDDVQRLWAVEDHGRRVARPRRDVLEGGTADVTVQDDACEYVCLSVRRLRRQRLRRVRRRLRHEQQEPGRSHLRDQVRGRRPHVGPVRRGCGGRCEPERLPPEYEVPRRDHRELRRQPDVSGACVPDVRGLGPRRPVRRQVHADRRRRQYVVGRDRRQRRLELGDDRPVPAVGQCRTRRRGRRRVLRQASRLPE